MLLEGLDEDLLKSQKYSDLWGYNRGMVDKDVAGRDYFQRVDPLKVDDVEEMELAYALQNSQRQDPDLWIRLINRYATDLYRWVEVLQHYQQIIPPTQEQIFSFLQLVFSRAIKSVDQFHGQASVSTWLFGITYQAFRGNGFIDWAMRFARKEKHRDRIMAHPGVSGWEDLEKVPEKLRTPLVLRYLFGLGLADIASILSLEVSEAHQRLISARNLLLEDPVSSDMDALLQAYLDGLYDEDPEAQAQIVDHVNTCENCQLYIKQLVGLEKSLAESLSHRWERKELDQAHLDALVQSVFSKIGQGNVKWKPGIKLQQVAWIAGLSTLFLILAIIFIRLTPAETEFPQAVITSTPPLPPIINMPPELVSAQNDGNLSRVPQYIAPAFSADGSWGVFTMINVGTNTQAGVLASVELYNKETNTLELIRKNALDLRIPWVYWDLAPGISADGKLVVYVGATRDTIAGGQPCDTATQQPCLDVFLYNRDTGTTMMISQAWNGAAADGDSLAPTISQDGNWVAFWSAADNIVQDNHTCLPANPGATCLNIILYEVQTGKIEQIPVGVIPGDVVFGVDRISMSSDGRYIGFTAPSSSQAGMITPTSLQKSATPGIITVNPAVESVQPVLPNAASRENMTDSPPAGNPLPAIQQSSEAVVYDRQTGMYEFENRAQDGTPGNGASSTPVLSDDGRYVAFVSGSTNLVKGDDNRFNDVFVRDRQTGAIELVSVSTNGQQGNDDSGITYWGRGFYSINISNDGRYVVFESAATNLVTGVNRGCSRFDIPACTLLYVHDRQTGQTDFIANLSLNVLSHFPEISANGRWVSFMQFSNLCLPTQNYCSNVMVYDRQRGWMSNLTRYGEQSASLPWTNSAYLQLPWQAWESSALTFSTDGKLFAVGGFDAKVRIWRITSGLSSINQDHPDEIISTDGNDNFTTIAFSPDGSWLAAGTARGLVEVWDVSSEKLLYSLGDQADPIRKLEFTQDGTHLIVATLTGTWMWSIGEGALVRDTSISYGSSAVFALDISAQGNLLATARGDGTVWLQTLPGGELIGRLGGQQVAADNLAFSPDGTMLAARSAQGKINLWKLAGIGTDNPSFTLLSAFPSYMYAGALVFSPDNKFLASTGMIGEITLWSVPDGKIYTLSSSVNNEMVYGVTFSSVGDMMAVLFEDQVGLWTFPPDYVSTYYVRAGQDQFIDSSPLPLSTANDIPQFMGDVIGTYSTIDKAAAASPFPLLVPTHLPEDFTLWDAIVNKDGTVVLRYFINPYRSSQWVLYVYEQLISSSSPPTMTIGASANVSLALVETASAGIVADYVRGDWKQGVSISPPKIGEMIGTTQDVWIWDNSSGSQRLRWQQNGILIALYYQVDNSYKPVLTDNSQSGKVTYLSSTMVKSDLIQVANGMDWYSNLTEAPACYGAGGSLVYAAWPAGGFPEDRVCLHPSLVSKHFDQKYGLQ